MAVLRHLHLRLLERRVLPLVRLVTNIPFQQGGSFMKVHNARFQKALLLSKMCGRGGGGSKVFGFLQFANIEYMCIIIDFEAINKKKKKRSKKKKTKKKK